MAKKISSSNQKITIDYTNMMSEAVGSRHGTSEAELDRIAPEAARAFKIRTEERRAGKLPFMDLPYKKKEAKEILAYAASARKKFDNFVVLGIGGSALGPICLQSALNPLFYNLDPKLRHGCPRIFVEDNVDPERIADMLDILDPKKTLVNVITKSGGTAETMSALLIARNFFAKRIGAGAVKDHIVATTDASKGNLRKIADADGLASFIVPDGVGGRFSVMCAVGLLPAAMAGIDINGLLDGAAAMDKRCSVPDIRKNPALLRSALQFLADTRKGKIMQVVIPYSNALRDIADWYRQLWAESLGKKYSLDNKIVNTGQTPIKALGATDQHSQVQLYNEGPNNKTLTFLRVENFRREVTIPAGFKDIEGIAYLCGRKMSDLLNAEEAATEIALTKFQRPNMRITLPEISVHTLGQLMYMFELETAYAGALYNINPFDQPGVEAGKIATYALMGRPGYEKQAAEINKALKGVKRKMV